MHELSIALSILDLARKEATAHNAQRVTELEIEVGKLSGVDTEALSFVLESVVRETELENCRILIHPIDGRCHCNDCGSEYLITGLLQGCPHCGSGNKELIAGRELKLKSLLID